MNSKPDELVRYHSLATLTLVSLLGLGCGDSVRYAPVQGVITDSMGPVEGVRVLFDPVSVPPGHSSAGVTDANGSYTLMLVEGNEIGAVVGENRVILSFGLPSEEDDELTELPTRQVPLRYRDGSTTYEVPTDGSASADFQIDSKPSR